MRTKGALGRKPRKDKQINVRIEDWELEQLKDYAEYCQMTLSELIIAGAKLYYQRQRDIYDKIMEEVCLSSGCIEDDLTADLYRDAINEQKKLIDEEVKII